jgi:anti-sigma regulatory factor (Ser/Thr protein kinase)
MERNDLKRVLALAIQDALGPRQDRGTRLAEGRDLQQLLGTAHRWVGECLDQIDQEAPTAPGLRRHLEALEDREAAPERRDFASLRLSMELPDQARTVPLCRRLLRAVLQELAVDSSRADDIELALSEAAGNVIQHAYPQPGHRYFVEIELWPDRLRFIVCDQGSGCDAPPPGEPDLDQPGGRGLWLIERLADQMSLSRGRDGGCRLEAEFLVDRRPEARHRIASMGQGGGGQELLLR